MHKIKYLKLTNSKNYNQSIWTKTRQKILKQTKAKVKG